MNLLEKLLHIQKGIDVLVKDGQNTSDKYRYVSSDQVLETVRPLMNELKLLLVPEVSGAALHEGTTKSGTTRYMTELTLSFVWADAESGEKLAVPFYAQGVDLAGEKGVGKALTYAEKYFLMKFFHVSTAKDDPDNDGRTGTGEKSKRGTQAAKETAVYQREAIRHMLTELCKGVDEDVRKAMLAFTKSESRGYAGVSAPEELSDAAAAVTYGKVKAKYEAKTGKAWTYKEGSN